MPKRATGKKNHPKPEARLGIFWLVDGKLMIDSAPLSECEEYGDHLNYPSSHIRVWERWQQIGKVPPDIEYEEYARGRVMCDKQGEKFTLLADRCILKHKELIAEIKKSLYLPNQITLGTDPHYRCLKCLHGAEDDEG